MSSMYQTCLIMYLTYIHVPFNCSISIFFHFDFEGDKVGKKVEPLTVGSCFAHGSHQPVDLPPEHSQS